MDKTKLISIIVFCIIFLSPRVYGGNQEKIIVQCPFKAVKKVYPDYPEALRKEGVAARFVISIIIDRKGNVIRANIWNHLYPELEENIEKAIAQWKFEPYIHKGSPIRIFGFMKVIFYPGQLSLPSKDSEPERIPLEEEYALPVDEELRMVLDNCTAYCLKLSESALYYICHESIREKLKSIKGSGMELLVAPPQAINSATEFSAAGFDYLTMEDTKRHTYIFDYQLIRKEGEIEEKRILMEQNKKSIRSENVPSEVMPTYSLKSILIPVQLLGIEQRSRFSFRLAEDEKIKGEPVYVLEASLRPGQTDNIKSGKVWVDKSDFRIVKAEVETVFVEGFEQALAECSRYYLKPHFRSTHYYGIEKNGLLFPSRSEIRVEYSGFLGTKKDLKTEVEVKYENYKFFVVETDNEILKKKLEALFLYLHQPKFLPLASPFPDIKKYFEPVH